MMKTYMSSTLSSSRKRPLGEVTNCHPSKRPLTASSLLNNVQKPEPDSGPEFNRMRVFVRVRPESEKEQMNANVKTVVEVQDRQMLVFDPKESNNEYFYKGKVYKEIGSKANKNLSFCFDRVFDDQSTNHDVYQDATKNLVDALLDGFNCTVFAYGATGSGKTHTMIGNPEEPGVIYYTTVEIFNRIQEKANEGLEISVSYIEIYNEQVYDLLSPSLGKTLAVREDPKRGVTIANLSVHHPADAKHLIKMIEFGNNNRAKQATDANSQSSRSHAIFQLYLKKQEYNGNQQMCIQLSKMSLIDLAGSERASVAYKENRNKSLQREGSNINKSLLALGNCINALANLSKKKMTGYVPYRDSKLTLLLRDSLGGNCFTAMIAAISPTSLCFEDTHNTLNYAKRAKGIEFNVSKKSVSITLEPHHYAKALEAANKRNSEMEEEIADLHAQIKELKEKLNSVPEEPIACDQSSIELLNRYKNTLTRLFEERNSLRLQYLEYQSEIKKIDLKMLFKKMDLRRIRSLEGKHKEENARALVTDDDFSVFFAKRENCLNQLRLLEERIEQNEAIILQLESQIRSQVEDDDFVINAYFNQQHTACEFNDKRFAEKHANQIFGDFLTRFENFEELIIESMELHSYVQDLLSGMGRLSDGLQERFNAMKKKVEGKKRLVWRDNPLDKRRVSVYEQHNLKDIFLLGVYESKSKTPAKPNHPSNLTSVYSVTPSYY